MSLSLQTLLEFLCIPFSIRSYIRNLPSSFPTIFETLVPLRDLSPEPPTTRQGPHQTTSTVRQASIQTSAQIVQT